MGVALGVEIGSAVLYLGSLFYIYRIWVSAKDGAIEALRATVESKDATLENLRENNRMLHEQLKETRPDILAERLSTRIALLEKELALNNSENTSEFMVQQIELELKMAREKVVVLSEQLERANELLKEYHCPHCQAPLESREFGIESWEDDDGRAIDVEHEFIKYECGLEMVDGQVISPCPPGNSLASKVI